MLFVGPFGGDKSLDVGWCPKVFVEEGDCIPAPNSGSGSPRIPKGIFTRYKPPPSGPRVVMNNSSRSGPPKVQDVGDFTGKCTI